MSTKSREVIWGGQIMGAKMRAKEARKRAQEAAREADRAEAEAWSVRIRLWRPGAAGADDRAVPQRRIGLA